MECLRVLDILLLIAASLLIVHGALPLGQANAMAGPQKLWKRAAENKTASNHSHHHMIHSHLSRKVFERACAASKDTIDEIIACLTNNQQLVKTVKPESATSCFKETFGLEFDPTDFHKHKELICNNREKFESLTACIYRKTAEASDPKEMEKFMESLVDVGLCIINALDG